MTNIHKYLATRDTDRRLEILESAPRDFLDQLEEVASKVDEEGLQLARVVLRGHEESFEEYKSTPTTDDEWNSCGDEDDWYDGCEECKSCSSEDREENGFYGGCEEYKSTCSDPEEEWGYEEDGKTSEGDRNLASLLSRLEEGSATMWSCICASPPCRRIPRLVAETLLRKARDAGPPGTPAIRISQEFLTETQFADLILTAHDTMSIDENMLDAMTNYAISLKFGEASPSFFDKPSPPSPNHALVASRTKAINFDAHYVSKRAAEIRDGKSFGQSAFRVAPDWERRIQIAQGSYAPRVPPNPGAGPCLVGIDFDALDQLIGPPQGL